VTELPQPQTHELNPPEPADTAAPVPSVPPHFTVRDIFVGADGIRAGWSLLIFAAIFLALIFAASVLLQRAQDNRGAPRGTPQTQSQPKTPPDAAITAKHVFLQEGLPLFCVVLATWLMAKIERRPAAAYGFNPQHSVRNFAAGLAWGVALLSSLVFGLRVTGLLVFDAHLLFGSSIFRYGAVWLAGFLLVGLVEEALNRGYLQYTLSRGLSGTYRFLFGAEHANAVGFWIAALILSFIFGFGHRTNPGESPLGMLSAGMAGLLFCFSLWRTGSLWWAIGFHASWDWAQSFLYGVADSGVMVQGHLYATHPVGRPYLSGGLTGPEGSLLLLPVLAAAVGVVLLTLPRTHSGYKPANTPSPPAALDLP
jgi:membrane protease YdiL (CAAX protease family)